MRLANDVRDGGVGAGRDEHASETAARAHDQQDAGNRAERLVGEAQDAPSIESAGEAERLHGQDRGHEHGDERTSRERDRAPH